jgi:hypothetical protein
MFSPLLRELSDMRFQWDRRREPFRPGRLGKRSEPAISTATAIPTSCFKTPAAARSRSGKWTGTNSLAAGQSWVPAVVPLVTHNPKPLESLPSNRTSPLKAVRLLGESPEAFAPATGISKVPLPRSSPTDRCRRLHQRLEKEQHFEPSAYLSLRFGRLGSDRRLVFRWTPFT